MPPLTTAGHGWGESLANTPLTPDQTHAFHVNHHANSAGEYLGGLVFYEFLYGTSPRGNKFRPQGRDADYARFLQEMAHKAVGAK